MTDNSAELVLFDLAKDIISVQNSARFTRNLQSLDHTTLWTAIGGDTFDEQLDAKRREGDAGDEIVMSIIKAGITALVTELFGSSTIEGFISEPGLNHNVMSNFVSVYHIATSDVRDEVMNDVNDAIAYISPEGDFEIKHYTACTFLVMFFEILERLNTGDINTCITEVSSDTPA